MSCLNPSVPQFLPFRNSFNLGVRERAKTLLGSSRFALGVSCALPVVLPLYFVVVINRRGKPLLQSRPLRSGVANDGVSRAGRE